MAKGKDGNSWIKSKAHTVDSFPGQKCQPTKHSPTHGSHERLSGKHNQGARGKDNTLRNAENCLGSHTRTFSKGLPEGAPLNFKGSGSKHSKELG